MTSLAELREAASTARASAYAPYSKFDAGAAVRTVCGQIITGAVVENISLDLAMWAERPPRIVSTFLSELLSQGPYNDTKG